MAVHTFTHIATASTDAEARQFVDKFIAALDSFSNLTKINFNTNQPAPAASIATSTYGTHADLDKPNKTFTTGTVTAGTSPVLTGATWSTALSDNDLGRFVKITTTAGVYSCRITAINTGTNTVTMTSATAVVAGTSGAVTGIMGVALSNTSLNTDLWGALVYRFNDATQSTFPIYMKIYLGNYGSTPNWVIGIVVGTGIDAFGNLTGIFDEMSGGGFNWIAFQNSAASDTNARTWYFSAGAGRLSIMANIDGTQNLAKSFFTITRGKDGTGASVSEFVQMIMYARGNVLRQAEFTNTNIAYPAKAGWTQAVFGNIGSSHASHVYDGNTTVMPIQPLLGRLRPHAGDVIVCRTTEFPNGASTVVDGKTYMGFTTAGQITWGSLSNLGFLVRYE